MRRIAASLLSALALFAGLLALSAPANAAPEQAPAAASNCYGDFVQMRHRFPAWKTTVMARTYFTRCGNLVVFSETHAWYSRSPGYPCSGNPSSVRRGVSVGIDMHERHGDDQFHPWNIYLVCDSDGWHQKWSGQYHGPIFEWNEGIRVSFCAKLVLRNRDDSTRCGAWPLPKP